MNAKVGVRGIWAWPGPAYIYELLIVAVICLPFLLSFSMSGFACSVVTTIGICAMFLSSPFRKDLSAKDWLKFNHVTIWIMRAAALAAGYWLFTTTPGNTGRFIAVFVYAVLYVISENVAWRHKRAIEQAE